MARKTLIAPNWFRYRVGVRGKSSVSGIQTVERAEAQIIALSFSPEFPNALEITIGRYIAAIATSCFNCMTEAPFPRRCLTIWGLNSESGAPELKVFLGIPLGDWNTSKLVE